MVTGVYLGKVTTAVLWVAKPDTAQKNQPKLSLFRALKDNIFSAMNIPHRSLHNKTWQGYFRQKLVPVALLAAKKLMSASVLSVKLLYNDLDFANSGRMTRVHLLHSGVGTVIELFSGLVIMLPLATSVLGASMPRNLVTWIT